MANKLKAIIMRADRLLSILLLLQIHKRMTARQLSARLEVSERTIHRDMEALSTAGVPVSAERGAAGGWSLLEPYQTNLTGLNELEIQALFLTTPEKLLNDLGLRQAYEGALVKLLAALPSMNRRDAEDMRQRIYIDAPGWHPSPAENDSFPIVQEAVWSGQKLKMSYLRGDETTVERVVDPLGLVAKGKVWYLVAGIDEDIRTYRISRVQTAEVLDEDCVRPPDFDLANFWTRSTADFVANLPRYPVTLRVDPAALPRLRMGGHYSHIESVGEVEADGWQQVDMYYDAPHEALAHILSFGAGLIVREPTELREQVIASAQRILKQYA